MFIVDIVSELDRERAMRVYVYPRLVGEGKITAAEYHLRLSRLDAAIDLCNLLRDHGIHQTDQVPLRLTPAPGPLIRSSSTSKAIHIKGGE